MRVWIGVAAVLAAASCTEGTEGGAATASLQAAPAMPGLEAIAEVHGLTDEHRLTLEGSPIRRVLVLPERFAAETFVTAGPAWYALSYHHEGLTVSLHATDRVHAELDPQELERIGPPSETVRGEPARTTLNEQIRAVTWTEDGVAFALEVECFHALSDTRCTEPYWALDLADELAEARR